MKTTTPPVALKEIMDAKEVRQSEIYHALKGLDSSMNRQKIYDRLNSKNPTVANINSLLSQLGYSLVLVPNDKAARLSDDCYRLASE